MGLDVRITFTSATEDVHELAYQLACRIDHRFFYEHPCIAHCEADTYGAERYEVATWSRYWGPNYERGYWPDIRAVLSYLLEHTEGLRYGSDGDEGLGETVTPELLAEHDAAFNEGEGDKRGRWFDNEHLGSDGSPNRPNDAYGKAMIRNGWGAGLELYYSPATGERAEFRNGLKGVESVP